MLKSVRRPRRPLVTWRLKVALPSLACMLVLERRLVVGAERDNIVDEAGVKELAIFLDTEHIMLPTVPHEVSVCFLSLGTAFSKEGGQMKVLRMASSSQLSPLLLLVF